MLSCLVVLLTTWAANSRADVGSYRFSDSQKPYTTVTQGTLHAAGTDATLDTKTHIALGFEFPIGGQTVTEVSIGNDGELYFQESGAAGTENSIRLWAYGSRRERRSGFELRSTVWNNAPNRVFVVQWKNIGEKNISRNESANFQIHLHESSASVSVHYGNIIATYILEQRVGMDAPDGSFNFRSLPFGGGSWTRTRRGVDRLSRCVQWGNQFPPKGLLFNWSPRELDAALSDPEFQQTFPLAGAHDIKLVVQNTGQQTITTAGIQWCIDRQSVSRLTWNGSLAAGASTSITVTSMNVAVGRIHTLTATAESVNLSADAYSTNNTFSYDFTAALQGTYTVGTGGTFNSLAVAIEHLALGGIADNVRLELLPGRHSGQHVITEISRRSTVNILTIASQTVDCRDVTLTGDTRVEEYNTAITLRSVSGIHLTHLTFDIDSVRNNRAIKLEGRCGDIQIKDNCFNGLPKSYDELALGYTHIEANLESLKGKLEIVRNVLCEGSAGIRVTLEDHSDNQNSSIQIANNEFTNQVGRGILVNTHNCELKILDNHIELDGTASSASAFIGISIINTTGQFDILKNHINVNRSEQTNIRGIYLNNYKGDEHHRGNIVNNAMSFGPPDNNSQHNTKHNGIEFSSCENLFIAHNTIHSEIGRFWALQSYSSRKFSVFNNIFSTSTNGTPIQHSSVGPDVEIDYNGFFTLSPHDKVPDDSYTRHWINRWNRTTPFDRNSFFADPQFISGDSLRPRNSAYNASALYLEEVSEDINGNARHSTNRDPGAYAWAAVPNTLDAGLTELTPPDTGYAAGLRQVSVRLCNHGSETITSANIHWATKRLNGVQPSTPVAFAISNFVGTLESAECTTITLENYQTTLAIVNLLSASIGTVNGLRDDNSANNTRSTLVLPAAMCGDYTIGGIDPSFETVGDAFLALEDSGVCGPVRLLVRSGLYFGSFSLREVQGTSTINTVTLRSENSIRDSVVFSGFPAIRLFSSDNIHIEDVTFGRSRHRSNGILILDSTDNCEIRRCDFHCQQRDFNLPRIYGINVEPVNIKGLLVKECRFFSGHNGVVVNPVFRFEQLSDISIIDNQFLGVRDFSVKVVRAQNVVVKGNTIESRETDSFGTQLHCEELTGTLRISDNRFVRDGKISHAVVLKRCIGEQQAPALFTNNIIVSSVFSFAGSILQLSDCNNWDIAHNTVVLLKQANWYEIPIRIEGTNTAGFRLYNNIAANYAGGPCLFLSQSELLKESDNNCLFSSGQHLIKSGLASMRNLNEWHCASALDSQSVSYDPGLSGRWNGLPLNIALADGGQPLAITPRDINNRLRDPESPSIGAIEFEAQGTDASLTDFSHPVLPLPPGTHSLAASVSNNAAEQITAATIHWSINSSTQPTVSWSGLLASGQSVNITLSDITISTGVPVLLSARVEVADDIYSSNNTLNNFDFGPGLSGYYEIGVSAADFATMAEVEQALSHRGVTGACIFAFQDGTHTGTLNLDSIPGSSSTHTISFTSVSGDPLKSKLTNSRTSDSFIFRLTKVQHVSISSLSLQSNNGNEYGTAILIREEVHEVNVEGCKFFGTIGSDNLPHWSSCILVDAAGGLDGLTIKECSFYVGYDAIHFVDNHLQQMHHNIEVSACVFERMSHRIATLCNIDGLLFQSNRFGLLFDKSGVAVDNSSAVRIKNNQFFVRSEFPIFHMTNVSGDSDTATSVIVNNDIVTTDNPNLELIKLQDCSHIHVLHNSLRSREWSNTEPGLLSIQGGEGMRIANNLLVVQNHSEYPQYHSGPIMSLSSMSVVDQLDYNCYSPAEFSFVQIGEELLPFTEFTARENVELHAVLKTPHFTSNTINISDDSILDRAGTSNSVVVRDYHNKIRNAAHPDIGAYEFTPPSAFLLATDLSSPATPFTPGTYIPRISVTNKGGSTITSASINWSVNGTTMATVTWSGTLAVNESTEINLGPLNLQPLQRYDYQAWIGSVNGRDITDHERADDTVGVAEFYTALGGEYTLGGDEADFTDFAGLTRILNIGGVYASVEVAVSNGVYDEFVQFLEIPGTSAADSVLVFASTTDPADVIISGDSVTINRPGVVTFDDCKYVTLRGMTINEGRRYPYSLYEYSSAIYLGSRAKFIAIDSCVFIENESVRWNEDGAIANFPAGGFPLAITNNTFLRWKYACNIRGSHNDADCGALISNNKLIGQREGGISLNSAPGSCISNNRIQIGGRFAMGGIIAVGFSSSIVVSGNTIHGDEMTGPGIWIRTNAAFPEFPLQISNNMVAMTGTTACSGIKVQSSTEPRGGYIDAIYNSVLIESPGGPADCAAYVETGNSGGRFLNNNLVSLGGAPAFSSQSVSLRPGSTFDFNNFYSTGDQLAAIDGAAIGSLSELQDSTETNRHSMSVFPELHSKTDLRSYDYRLNGAAQPVEITTDIDGQSRSQDSPDIGADEFNPPMANVKLLTLDTPLKIFPSGSHPISATIQNVAEPNLTSALLAWSVNDEIQDTIEWHGDLAGYERDSVYLGEFNFNQLTEHSVRAWVWNPNDTLDGDSSTDTLQINGLVPGLEGVYTIGASGADLPSLAEFQYYLQRGGMTGPTTGQMLNGQFVEHVIIDTIAGLSAAAPLVLESQSGIADSVVVEFDSTAARPEILWIEKASNITLRNFTIYAGEEAESHCVEIRDTCSKILFSGMVIKSLAPSTSYQQKHLINSPWGRADSLTFTGCRFIGGGSGIDINNVPKHILVHDCEFSNQRYTAVNIERAINLIIEGNDFRGESSTSVASTAISLKYLTGWCRVVGNRATSPDQFTALKVEHASSLDSALIANNFFAGKGTVVRMNYTANVAFIANSIKMLGAVNSQRALMIEGSNTNLFLHSNIIAMDENSTAEAVYVQHLSEGRNFNNNAYFAGDRPVSYRGLRKTLGEWQNLSGMDKHSLNVNPLFVSDSDLHAQNDSLINKGMFDPRIARDIDGQYRDNPPDIGADEFQFNINDIAAYSVNLPDACTPSTNASLSVRMHNRGSSFFSTHLTVQLTVTGATTATLLETTSVINFDIDAVETYTLAGTLPFSATGMYNLELIVSFKGDKNPLNDTLRVQHYQPAPFSQNHNWDPVPADSTIAHTNATLSWRHMPDATSYDLYFWPANEDKPTQATIEHATTSHVVLNRELDVDAWYKWQLTAHNDCENIDSPVWHVRGSRWGRFDIHVFLDVLIDSTRMDTALKTLGFLPDAQPFNNSPWHYAGFENANTLPAASVDWILLELRRETSGTIAYQEAAILLNNGRLVDPTSGQLLYIPILRDSVQFDEQPYHLVLHSRTHLAIASDSTWIFDATPDAQPHFDVRTSQTDALRLYADPLQPRRGALVLFPGDVNQDGIVNAYDRVAVRRNANQIGYLSSDVNHDGVVNAIDRIIVRNNSFKAAQIP